MFEDYFVTCNVAVALRKIGFDEPCMAIWEFYQHGDNTSEELHISYLSHQPDFSIYNEKIQELKRTRPGMFQDQRSNTKLPPWLFAAPLYSQAFTWLERMGLYLHPYRIKHITTKSVFKWGVNIYDKDGNHLWPTVAPDKNYHDKIIRHWHRKNFKAFGEAIIAAIKILSNEHHQCI